MDQFRIQEAITFVQQTPPETFRLMDVTINNIPVAYEHGKILATAAVVDLKVAEEVNIFTMSCETGVSLKLISTVSTALTNVTHFSYKGNKISFWVSNPGTEDISITYSTCSL